MTYTDCIWSAYKSVSVAWALAPTEAERQIIILAHRDAVAASMAYLETHLGFTKRGQAGSAGLDPGVTAWVTADHYTARPTAEIAMVKDGQAYTEFETIPREHDGDSDFTSWRKQAAEEIGYHHRSVLRPRQEQGLRPEAERHRVAYEVSLPLIEEALRGRAKLDAAEFREYAVRGLVEAGISDKPDRDIKAIMGMYREHGVRQDGEMVRIVFDKDVPLRGKDRWSVTTERHIEDEQAVVSLAQKLAADRSMAFSHGELERASQEATIQRVAAKWLELTATDPTSAPTIGVASNRDAHDIGIAVRQKLQEAGKIGRNETEIGALMRGKTGIHKIPLAEGDRVRVLNRVWIKEGGLGHFASNGDVLDVLEVSARGMRGRNADGKEASITWDKLTGRYERAPRLAYGHALTIDASQGTTSRVHIDAVLSGSWYHQGGKGYVNESRQVETTHLIVNEAAERREIFPHVPRGEHRIVRDDGIWKHVADNMNRPTTKASALDFLHDMTSAFRGNLTALPAALEPAERRERAGEVRMTLHRRMERITAELAPVIQRTMDLVGQQRDIWSTAAEIGRRQPRAPEQQRGYERER